MEDKKLSTKENSLERSSGKKKSSKAKSKTLQGNTSKTDSDAVVEKRKVFSKRRSVSEKKHPRVSPSKSSDSVSSPQGISADRIKHRPKPVATGELVVQRRERGLYSLENNNSSSSLGGERYLLTAEDKVSSPKAPSKSSTSRPPSGGGKGSPSLGLEDKKSNKSKKTKESSKKDRDSLPRSLSEIPTSGHVSLALSCSPSRAHSKPTRQDITDILDQAHARGSSPRPQNRGGGVVSIELPSRSSSEGVGVPRRSSTASSTTPGSKKKSSSKRSKSRDRRDRGGITSDDDGSDLESSFAAHSKSPNIISSSGNSVTRAAHSKSDASSQHSTPDFVRKHSGGTGASSAGADVGGLHGSGGSMGSGGGSGGAVAQIAGLDMETRDRAVSFSTLINDPLLASIPPHMVIPASDLNFGTELGQGSFGVVWKGTWRAIPVAIKQCMLFKREFIDEFKREAEMVLRIRPHPNIVQTLGICPDPGRLSIVMEYLEKGSLDKILAGPKTIPMKKLLRVIKGIAAGVYHLHSENIVHRDLAARNILMSESFQPRVADFGFSRAVDRDGRGKTNANTGPIKWMAPESLRTKEYSKMSDVWSFGILCYEILSRKEPHVDANPTEIGYKIMTEYVTPPLPVNTPLFLMDLVNRCWSPNPQVRPSMREVTTILNEKIE